MSTPDLPKTDQPGPDFYWCFRCLTDYSLKERGPYGRNFCEECEAKTGPGSKLWRAAHGTPPSPPSPSKGEPAAREAPTREPGPELELFLLVEKMYTPHKAELRDLLAKWISNRTPNQLIAHIKAGMRPDAEMRAKFLEGADDILQWAGCPSGDCPHKTQVECEAAMLANGKQVAAEFLQDAAPMPTGEAGGDSPGREPAEGLREAVEPFLEVFHWTKRNYKPEFYPPRYGSVEWKHFEKLAALLNRVTPPGGAA